MSGYTGLTNFSIHIPMTFSMSSEKRFFPGDLQLALMF